ncbi:unnamed protein product [Didymodactylos carnosus]|uniref:Protein regulator of cytokinesis 1 n=2 Tax=Didymodactylos carnosus TaxID=1234261 RepID=A0A813UFE3_9BILA|nr:unnamed protein product [Didymodactylos carnosus]CAF3613783.1 unnamed protein product [Didymodactylos carnosus]
MSDRTFNLEEATPVDPTLTDRTVSILEQTNNGGDQSFECCIEHLPFYRSIESDLLLMKQYLFKRGLNEQDIVSQEEIVINVLKESLNQFIQIEKTKNENLLICIDNIMKECDRIHRLLELEWTIEKPSDDLSLFEQMKQANNLLESSEHLFKIKTTEINEMRIQEEKLCQKLHEKIFEFNNENETPFAKRKIILENHIHDLTNLQVERSSRVEQYRQQIHQMKIELELNDNYGLVIGDDNNILLIRLIDGPFETIELSNANVVHLQTLANELDIQYQKNKIKGDQLINQLKALYERLNINEVDQEIKLPTNKPDRPSNLIKLEREIERCKDIRRQNMKTYILNIREEIFMQYEKCFYSREQMELFPALYSNVFTEETLEQHEKELEEMKTYYERNEQIFIELRRWMDAWDEFKKFEFVSSDPNRFKQRGYSAINEEKERRHIETILKKAQENILMLADEYEQTHGHSFHVDGISITDFFTHEKENYSQEKELEKARKQLARGQTPILTNAQHSAKRQLAHTEMMKTPSRQQQFDIKVTTPFRPASAINNKRLLPLQPQQNKVCKELS